jgi:hypothetical protein
MNGKYSSFRHKKARNKNKSGLNLSLTNMNKSKIYKKPQLFTLGNYEPTTI